MSWILPALIAPLIWAIVNLIDDNLVRHVYKGADLGAIISGAFGLVPAALILAHQGSVSLPTNLILLSVLAGFLNVFYYYFYFRGLEVEHPSVVIALFCLTPAVIPFVAYYLVDERLTMAQMVGFAIIIISALVYSITDIKKPRLSKALVPVLISATILNFVVLTNKYVYTKADFYDSYFYFSIGMFLGGLYFFYVLLFEKGRVSPKKIWKKNSLGLLILLAMVEFLNIAAEYIRNFAISRGPVSLVEALSNIQPLYILLISVALFPLFPKFFPEAQAGNMKIKLLMSLTLIFGVFLTIR